MLASVVFVTQLLGLTTGEQPIEVRADPGVTCIELRRDGEPVASITRPPWRTVVDLGPDLLPFELSAHAFDAEGRDRGSDKQTVNLARPPAEVQILLERRDDRIFATLHWNHLLGASPRKAVLMMDGKVVSERASAGAIELPFVTADSIHSLNAVVEFPEHVVARKETVFGGVYSELVAVELTPVIVREGADRCNLRGRTIDPASIIRGEATIEFIFNGRPGRAAHVVEMKRTDARFVFDGIELRVMSPIAETFRAREQVRTDIFPSGRVVASSEIRRLLRAAAVIPRGKAQVADSVAAAAVTRLATGRRGAVVLVLGEGAADDQSSLSAAVVRRYCETIGVPLHVWSFVGATSALRDAWGDVSDISRAAGLSAAIVELRRDLESQRVAWLPLTPLEAVRADCGRPQS